jgi:hypothetical protein
MNARQLILLSPYRLPAQHALTLSNEDMAAWLNGYISLWHPAALWQATGPPKVESPYDHETPRPGHVYAVPESPPSLLPDDWPEKVRAVGAVVFRATPDQQVTLANLRAALTAPLSPAGNDAPAPTNDDGTGPEKGAGTVAGTAQRVLRTTVPDPFSGPNDGAEVQLAQLPGECVAQFSGIGFGYMLLEALSEAMEHENLLESNDFWEDLQRALAAVLGLPTETPGAAAEDVPTDITTGEPAIHSEVSHDGQDPDFETPPPAEEPAPPEPATAPAKTAEEPWLTLLQSAALRLLSAREMLYPVAIHLLDLVLLDDKNPGAAWPLTAAAGQPINVVAPAATLEKLAREHPEQLAELARLAQAEQAEVCGGAYLEREDTLLPIESQLWNLRKGLLVTKQLLGTEVRVFARRRFGAHPQLPVWLNHLGINKCVLLSFDEGAVPTYNNPTMSWSTTDGKQLDCFVRKPLAVDSVDTFFNLGHFLFKTTREDHTATLAFLHTGAAALPWYADLVELSKFGAIAGTWTTLWRYFSEASTGEYVGSLAADDFHFDYLSERVPQQHTSDDAAVPPVAISRYAPSATPVSGFAQQVRWRRRLDTCWTLAALQRGLAGRNDPPRVEQTLCGLEDELEKMGAEPPAAETMTRLADVERQVANNLAERLVARAQQQQAGYLLLNPCSFTRRVALEVDGRGLPIPVTDPVKACQVDGDKLRLVAEVPPLGFAWFPQAGPPGTPVPPMRIRLADERCVRNEFLEAEIDPATGGLRAIRDHKTMLNRLSQRLIFRPGSVMKVTQVKTTSTGPALGEIVTEGALLGAQQQVLAKFRQRFRAWLGRPILDLRIELYPEQPPAGYPWHAYFGAQFAWRDERATLLRGQGGIGHITTHVRPQTPDYLEVRLLRQSTVILPGGLPFHQREGGRMVDVILVPPGETAQVFDIAIGLDREQPMQTALGLATPVTVVPTTKGPPHIGAKGWLFHLDASNLLLTSMHPGGLERAEEGQEPQELTDTVTARLVECSGFSTAAELRCVRNPHRVAMLDARGQCLMESSVSGDGALFHVGPGDLAHVQVQFGDPKMKTEN